MNEGHQASQTALLVAAYRADGSRGEAPLCDDPWAAALAGDDGASIARRMTEANPHMPLFVGVRTAFFDGEVRRLIGEGARQVVVLGAGFDTRAARLAAEGVRFFEVDHPATQADKLARLRRLPAYPLEAASYVGCDFERDDFVERLVASGFDPGAPAAVLWEGVTYYLHEPAVRATLRRVSGRLHPRSTVLFDHVGKKMATSDSIDPGSLAARRIVVELGEPFRWGVNDILPLLVEEGYRHVQVTTADEACLNLTGTYARERAFRFIYLVAASARGPARWPG